MAPFLRRAERFLRCGRWCAARGAVLARGRFAAAPVWGGAARFEAARRLVEVAWEKLILLVGLTTRRRMRAVKLQSRGARSERSGCLEARGDALPSKSFLMTRSVRHPCHEKGRRLRALAAGE